MTSAQIRLFSQKAADSHSASFGQVAGFNGVTISIVCQPLSDQELMGGGWERSGIMKALVQGNIIPGEHDRLGIDGKTWVVRKKIINLASVETALFLETVAGVRDL